MDYHKLPRKYLSKNGKLECIIDHYQRVRGEHIDDSGDSSGSEDEQKTDCSEMESYDGDIV